MSYQPRHLPSAEMPCVPMSMTLAAVSSAIVTGDAAAVSIPLMNAPIITMPLVPAATSPATFPTNGSVFRKSETESSK